MSEGSISHYSSRNLDACTLHLNRWRPFVPPPSTSSEGLDPCQPVSHLDASIIPLVPLNRPLEMETGRVAASPALRFVKCSFKQIMSSSGAERFRWACHPFKAVSSPLDNQRPADPSSTIKCIDPNLQHYDMMKDLNSTVENHVLGLNDNPSLMHVDMTEDNTDNQSLDPSWASSNGDTNQVLSNPKDVDTTGVSPTLGVYRVTGYLTEQAALVKPHNSLHPGDSTKIPVLAPSLSGWSKRHKQLSRALARGLWRWKENSQARKRRRKCGSSRSGSGRSTESRRARINMSDAPTMGASGNYATCSDIPMPGTDSSGELFFYGDSSGISWDPEFSLSGEGVVQRIDGVDVLHAWIISDSQNPESGYGSEPGYRGDGELGYEDDGIPDEEEREQFRLGPWRDSSTKMAGIVQKIDEDEDLMIDTGNMCESKAQHRIRRRRPDLKPPTGQRSRHAVCNGELKGFY